MMPCVQCVGFRIWFRVQVLVDRILLEGGPLAKGSRGGMMVNAPAYAERRVSHAPLGRAAAPHTHMHTQCNARTHARTHANVGTDTRTDKHTQDAHAQSHTHSRTRTRAHTHHARTRTHTHLFDSHFKVCAELGILIFQELAARLDIPTLVTLLVRVRLRALGTFGEDDGGRKEGGRAGGRSEGAGWKGGREGG